MGSIFSCFRAGSRSNGNRTETNHNFKSDDVDVDLSSYMYQGLDKEVVGKLPGQLKGEDFLIDNCKNSSIYLLDHSAAVTIDDCTDDVIFIAPCKGSVFVRDCVRCIIMVSCQQFRARDCTQCTVYLHCTSQPVIEASSEMKFGCFQCHYPELRDQFCAAGLSIFNNNWYSIHNFTPQIEDSWSLIRKDSSDSPVMVFSPSIDNDLNNIQLTFDPSTSVVPYTHSLDNSPPYIENCLIVFMNCDDVESLALDYTQQLLQNKADDDVIIIQTKEIHLDTNCSAKVTDFFTGIRSGSPPPQGHVIFMEVCGNDCISICTSVLSSRLSSSSVYWSRDREQGAIDVKEFHELSEQNFRL